MFRQKLVSGALAAALALSPALAFGQDQTSNQGSLAKTGAGGVANLAQVPEEEQPDDMTELYVGGALVAAGVIICIAACSSGGGGGGGGTSTSTSTSTSTATATGP